MGCCIHTTLKAGIGYTTVEIKVNYVRAMTDKTGPVRVEGKVISVGLAHRHVGGQALRRRRQAAGARHDDLPDLPDVAVIRRGLRASRSGRDADTLRHAAGGRGTEDPATLDRRDGRRLAVRRRVRPAVGLAVDRVRRRVCRHRCGDVGPGAVRLAAGQPRERQPALPVRLLAHRAHGAGLQRRHADAALLLRLPERGRQPAGRRPAARLRLGDRLRGHGLHRVLRHVLLRTAGQPAGSARTSCGSTRRAG